MQVPWQFYHQTPQQHGGGDNFHLTGGMETLQNALQYDSTSHTNNGNLGGVLAGKHHVKSPCIYYSCIVLSCCPLFLPMMFFYTVSIEGSFVLTKRLCLFFYAVIVLFLP
jgi:hypothetical protein